MKNRTLTTAAVIGIAAIGLTACGSSHTPTEIFEQYIENLNTGDMKSALNLVADTANIDPERIAFLEEYDSLLPLLAEETELDDDIETVAVEHRFGNAGYGIPIDFTKVDGDWMLSYPVLLEPLSGDGLETLSTLESAGYVLSTPEHEVDLQGKEHIVIPQQLEEVDLSVKVDETQLFDPFEVQFKLSPSGSLHTDVQAPLTILLEQEQELQQLILANGESRFSDYPVNQEFEIEQCYPIGDELGAGAPVEAALFEAGKSDSIRVSCDAQVKVTATKDFVVEGVSRDTTHYAGEVVEDFGRSYAATYTASGFEVDM